MSARLVLAGSFLLLLVIVLPTQSAPAPTSSRPSEAERLFREGMDFYLGLNRPMDYDRALKLFRKASARGHVSATAWVGRMLCAGRGAETDVAEGLKFVKQALPAVRKKADDGDADAQLLMGIFAAYGWGVELNKVEAFRWYRRSAENGNSMAMNNLGIAYKTGSGVEKNDKEAANWYKKAADRGVVLAMYNLAGLYKSGQGTERNDKEAVKWYASAAEKGHARSAYDLGLAYENGTMVERNLSEARSWYRKAVALGYESARERLKLLQGQE
jgi:uncharacterized protein